MDFRFRYDADVSFGGDQDADVDVPLAHAPIVDPHSHKVSPSILQSIPGMDGVQLPKRQPGGFFEMPRIELIKKLWEGMGGCEGKT